MASPDTYTTTRNNLLNQINSQKNIFKFRNFIYSINKEHRHRVFELTINFCKNELHNIHEIGVTESDAIKAFLNHFQWNTFENDPYNWWNALSYNHWSCQTLHKVINAWTEGWAAADANPGFIPDNGSVGLR